MPNDLYGTPAIISGGYASSVGGFLTVTDNDQEPPLDRDLDVGKWTIVEGFEETPLECGGNLGATDSRRTGYNFLFELELLLDLRLPADVLLRKINGVEIVFYLGDMSLSGLVDGAGNPLQSSVTLTDRYYWTPLAKLDTAVPVLDAAGKKIMHMKITGHCVAHLFLVPDMGDPFNGNPNDDKAAAYRQWFLGV